MGSWNDLAAEILTVVFECLKNNEEDLYQCQLACQNWRKPAQRITYSTICLDTTRGSIDSKARKLIDTIANSKDDLGRFVKSLEIEQRLVSYLDQLAELCPFSERIKGKGYLCGVYGTLMEVHGKSRLQHLESIPEPLEDDDIEDYVKCVLQLGNTLTNVLVCNKVYPDPEGEYDDPYYYQDQYERLCNSLNEFPKLSNLEIRKFTYSGVETFESIIEKCPGLTSIVYGIYQPFDKDFSLIDNTEDWEESEGDDDEATEEMKSIQPESKRKQRLADVLSSSVPRPNIKKVSMKARLISDDSLLYIVHKFPNLDYLEINNYKEQPIDDGYAFFHLDFNAYMNDLFNHPAFNKFVSYLYQLPACT